MPDFYDILPPDSSLVRPYHSYSSFDDQPQSVHLPDISNEHRIVRYNDKICNVCGAGGARICYKGMVCGSCKIFFARTVVRSVRYICSRSGECIINQDNRISCKACRFMMCLRANMSEAEVGTRSKNRPIAHANVVNSMPESLTIGIRESSPVGLHLLNNLKTAKDVIKYAKYLVVVENYCNSNEAEFFNDTSNFNLDLSIDELLTKPTLCSDRTSIGWKAEALIVKTRVVDVQLKVYCRTLTHYADFLSGCYPLAEICDQDRIYICKTSMCRVMLFTMIYNSYKFGSDGLLIALGYEYKIARRDNIHEFDEFLNELTEYLQKHVVEVFKEVRITSEEYSILKNIILYSNAPPGISDSSKQIIRSALMKHHTILKEYMTLTRRDIHVHQLTYYLSRLLSVVPYLQHAADRDNIYCARMVLHNMGNMKSKLAGDLHIW